MHLSRRVFNQYDGWKFLAVPNTPMEFTSGNFSRARRLTKCAALSLRLPSSHQFKGFVFSYEHCSSLFTVGFTPTQTLSRNFSHRFVLTTHE